MKHYRLFTILAAIYVVFFMPAVAFAQDVGAAAAETKSPIELWNGYAAVIAVLVTATVIRRGWSKGRQAAAAVIVSAIIALVGQWLTDGWDSFDKADPILAMMKVITLTQAAYQTLFQAIPLPQWIESKTGGDSMGVQDPYRIKDETDPATGDVVRKMA